MHDDDNAISTQTSFKNEIRSLKHFLQSNTKAVTFYILSIFLEQHHCAWYCFTSLDI